MTSRQLKNLAQENVREMIREEIEAAEDAQLKRFAHLSEIPEDQWPAYVRELRRIEEGI